MGLKDRKIMLGIDGSDRALEAVRYVSKVPSFRKYWVTLYNVFSMIPETYWDLERKGVDLGWRVRDVRAWEMQRKKAMKEHMDEAHQILLGAGFPGDLVEVKIQKRDEGFARDLIREARHGYSEVVIGRRGMSALRGLLLGSVATKLLERLTFAPLLLVGKKSHPEKILLGLDGSDNALRAVEHVGRIVGGAGVEIRLIHVVRGKNKDFEEKTKEAVSEFLAQAKSRLAKSGITREQARADILTGKRSRAKALVEIARKEGYGTIVLGRRGLSEVEDFSMGRVTNKVVYMAKGLAVWVVN